MTAAPTQAPATSAIKRRNPAAVWIGLPIITLGIYFFVWYYKIHREIAATTRQPDAPTAGPMLVILFLGWTGIAALVSFYNTGKRIRAAQQAAGTEPTCSPGLGLVLCFAFGLVTWYYQAQLNKIAS